MGQTLSCVALEPGTETVCSIYRSSTGAALLGHLTGKSSAVPVKTPAPRLPEAAKAYGLETKRNRFGSDMTVYIAHLLGGSRTEASGLQTFRKIKQIQDYQVVGAKLISSKSGLNPLEILMETVASSSSAQKARVEQSFAVLEAGESAHEVAT